jgi:hypothetical protein
MGGTTHRFILVIDRATGRRTVMELTATDAARLYSPLEVARLALGQAIPRGAVTHTDLLAFHDTRQRIEAAAPRRRGLAALLGRLAA